MSSTSRFFSRAWNRNADLFLSEEGAMIAEWKFFHELSPIQRKKIYSELMINKLQNNKQNDYLFLALKYSNKEVDEYLAAQRLAGRYSKEEIEKYGLQNFMRLSLPTAALSATALTVGTTKSLCSELQLNVDKRKKFPQFYDIICAQIISNEPTAHPIKGLLMGGN